MNDKVILIHPGGEEIPHDKDHAERLMSMPNNGGWKYKKSTDKLKNKSGKYAVGDTGYSKAQTEST